MQPYEIQKTNSSFYPVYVELYINWVMQSKILFKVNFVNHLKTNDLGVYMSKGVTTSAAIFIQKKILRKKGTVNHYQVIWRKIELFMEANNSKNFTKQVCTSFLFQHLGDRDYSTFSKREKDIIRGATVLLEFHNTGSIDAAFSCQIDLVLQRCLTGFSSYHLNIPEDIMHMCHHCEHSRF